MLGSKPDRKPADLSRVSLHEDWEVHFWSTHFETTAERLRAAVERVGPSAAEVEAELKHAGHEAFKNTGED